MADKDNFQKQVVHTLLNSGFKDIFQQKEHKEFIEMIAATYFSNQLTFNQMIEYIADIVQQEDKRKAIAEIIKDIKAPKIQKKLQPTKEDKQDKVEKKPQKKAKLENPSKPKQTKLEHKAQKVQESKKEAEQIQGVQGDQLNSMEKKGLKHELQKQGKVKCRFFPFCKNQETGCEFFHPTEKCQYFPHCRFGDNCLYIHEACRFKEKCTKLNCQYAHPGKRPTNPLQAFMKNMMMNKGANMFNKQKTQKKRPIQQDANQDQHQEQ